MAQSSLLWPAQEPQVDAAGEDGAPKGILLINAT